MTTITMTTVIISMISMIMITMIVINITKIIRIAITMTTIMITITLAKSPCELQKITYLTKQLVGSVHKRWGPRQHQ